jgi:SAM-dependent methyltransferase
MSYAFSGSGPGPQTADGCSVELYRALPYRDEIEPLRAFLAAGATLLELGCGSGRLTRRLVDWGLRVTAVDSSAHILAALPHGVAAVESEIETLNLGESFDIVLLASCLINHPEPVVRQGLVACAHRHLRSGGRLLLERQDPGWLRTAQPGPAGNTGDIAIHVEHVARDAELVHVVVRYELAARVWRQSFFALPLDEAPIEQLLGEAGFTDIGWHGCRRQWASGVAV